MRSPLASGRSSNVDPQVSSAIAKRILETLGEVSRPFQDARKEAIPAPAVPRNEHAQKRHRPEEVVHTPLNPPLSTVSAIPTPHTPDDTSPSLVGNTSVDRFNNPTPQTKAPSPPKDDSPSLPEDMEFHFAPPAIIDSTPRLNPTNATKNIPTYVFRRQASLGKFGLYSLL